MTLKKGCRVADLRDGEPEVHAPLSIWTRFSRATGVQALSLRILEIAPGLSPGMRNEDCDEVLYVIEGSGTALLDGHRVGFGPDVGIHLRPGVSLAFENPGPHRITVASARCPDGGPPILEAARTRPEPGGVPPGILPDGVLPGILPDAVARLVDRPSEVASDGRSYQVVIDASGSGAPVTQFVGSIPPGRAPDHFHEYEEVFVILEGQGRIWADRESVPVGPGSCVFLPRRQVHCLENLGEGRLRLLGVFYPSGSPAASKRSDRPLPTA
ncbi:MAG TPA: cupin domain-containing protein [Candidatus Polarisedimenticolia bacterium]|nr:cupin domain-containing protein [Candidatus Polarisedimenticolia bacterium]